MSLKAEIVGRLASAIKRTGFEEAGAQYSKQISADASVRLAFTTVVGRSGLVSASAMIGVRFESVCKAGVALGVVPDEKNHLSLKSDLRYLVPDGEKCDYEFTLQSGVDSMLGKLSRHMFDYGVPYFDTLTSVELALEALGNNKLEAATGFVWCVPIAHYVVGDIAQAVAAARGYLVGMNVRRPTGRQYAAFIDRLVAESAAGPNARSG